MGTDHGLTAEQAREQLRTSRETSLRSAQDSRTYAVGTAVLGLTVSLHLTAQNIVSGAAAVLASVLFLAVWLGEAWWVERRARTVPRRATLWSRVGIGASLLLGLVAVMPWLNLREQTAPNTWPMVLAGAAVAAAPSLLAAWVIARGARR